MKNIVFLSHSDTLGGAAIVSYRLMCELRQMGYSVKMLVFNRNSDDPDVIAVGNGLSRRFAFMAERADIFFHNGFSRKNLFKVSTGGFGINMRFNRYLEQADVIMVNWINQGLISLGGLRYLASTGKRIIWTMHDMWCMTGICHHAYECERYKDMCGDCPFLGTNDRPDDLSHRVWLRKKNIYNKSKNIRFVAISSWQREKARESSLLSDMDVSLIPNAFPVDSFPYKPIREGAFPGTKGFKNIITFGAARLDDPVKGLQYAIDALNLLVLRAPEFAAKSVAVFFGNVRNPHIFEDLRFPHIHVGTINDPVALQQLYATSKIVLSTSLYETLPGTIIEGMSCGAVPVAFGRGGQTDIIDHEETGYVAEYLDCDDVANGILWAASAGIRRDRLHKVVVDKFSANAIARRYLTLIDRE